MKRVSGDRWLKEKKNIYIFLFLSIPVYNVVVTGHTMENVFSNLCVWAFVFQGEKECLNSETTELKQKIRYLQDQLLPLSKQREYQEKEIQRLNRVEYRNQKKQKDHPHLYVHVSFLTLGFGRSLKPAFTFIVPTTPWSG